MKINVISRDDEDFTRDTSLSIVKQFYNPDPNVHKFEKPREVVRAINAAKYQKITARPFVGDLSGHADTPNLLCVLPSNSMLNSLKYLLSGSSDGEVRIWEVSTRKTLTCIPKAHNGFITGIVVDPLNTKLGSKTTFFSSGTDKHLKRWNLDLLESGNPSEIKKPIQTFVSQYAMSCVDHHFSEPILASGGGPKIDIWDAQRTVIKQSYEPSIDTVNCLKFNRVQHNLLALSSRDRYISLYDIKSGVVIQKVLMKLKTNSVCWNPMQPYRFSIANEDYNCYTFDMRYLSKGPQIMHAGHTNAVLDLDYSPAGDEIVTGSYDKTIRIFKSDSTSYKSREVYHTKRMRRVFSVKFSSDGKYIFSGSDDHAIRIWKSISWEPMRITSRKEQMKLEYQNQLLERYKDLTPVKTIHDHKHLPKLVYENSKIMKESMRAKIRRMRNKIKYTEKKTYKVEDNIASATGASANFLRAEQ